MADKHSIARAEFVPFGGDRRAYYALPAGAGPFPGVLVYQEAFGVNEYMQSEVRRCAEHGYAAIAPDLFHGEVFPYEFDKVLPKLQTLTDEGMLADVNDAIAFLDAQPQVAKSALGAVGFCMGGRLAFLSAVALPRVGAAVSFYGGGIAPDQPRHFKPLADRVPDVHGRLLLIYGADDQSIAPTEHGRLAQALSEAKKDYGIRVYPGAGHGFASRDRESYRPAVAQAAWDETFAVFAATLR
ncbi:MAG TPA: dienelactone hydrolase family protein [Candidatus Sulfotelmatobacter sp.]|nr:dienelactone hydrolase family protein [Candidatus Sulfotelmatobacter sp.]